jgi:serine/threonine protein kinase
MKSQSSLDGRAARGANLLDMSDHDQRLKKEIAILKKCRHPNVVRLREVIDAPASKKIYLGMYRIAEALDLYINQSSKTS